MSAKEREGSNKFFFDKIPNNSISSKNFGKHELLRSRYMNLTFKMNDTVPSPFYGLYRYLNAMQFKGQLQGHTQCSPRDKSDLVNRSAANAVKTVKG